MKPERKATKRQGVAGRRGAGFQIAPRQATRAVVIHPEMRLRGRARKEAAANGPAMPRSSAARLTEAVGLAEAIDLDVVGDFVLPVHAIRPATLLGAGKVEELAGALVALEAELVIVDAALTPVQQRNLERSWKLKVLDRTGLILEIFARRAQTREGRLQVELAQLTYQKSRLVRSWTHLERQRGALGFVGGPGETQKEADRRMIQERITRIEKELDAVRRTRTLHRVRRRKASYPVVALVGYTNAGKSTLFNALTHARVGAKDQLFATLDPTMRAVRLPRGRTIVLSDTVGFISDLPAHLVAAFRATLEEVIEADVLLHVRDISHPETRAQAEDVETVLAHLGIEEDGRNTLIEVWNKIDLLDQDSRGTVASQAGRADDVVEVSALTGEGLETLLGAIETAIARNAEELQLSLDAREGARLNWLYEHCEVLARNDRDDGQIDLTLRVPATKMEQLARRLGD